MKKRKHNLLLLVLTVAILFNSIYVNLSADENETDISNIVIPNISDSNLTEEPEIQDEIGEVERLREENVKHFYIGDGEYKAIVYASPVHRKDADGNWQDIDNILLSNETKNKKVYITSDGRTTFSGKVNSDERLIYNLQEKGYSISLYFDDPNIKNTSAKVSNHEKWNKGSGDVEELYKKAKMIDTNTTILYKNILKDVDFEYVLSNDNVKENIIINTKQENYEYSFTLKLDGLTPVIIENGAIYLYDKITNQKVYEMPAPYAYDADGNVTYDVAYNLFLNDTGYWTLKVVANTDWINATNRQFPVIIDPTFYAKGTVRDTYINKSAPEQNYGTSEDLWLSPREAIFFKFDVISIATLPTYADVTQVNFCAYYYFNVSTGVVDIACFSAPLTWNENQLTYNSVKNTCGAALPTKIANYDVSIASAEASDDIRKATPGLFETDITDLFLMWNTGQENKGLVLVYDERSRNESVVFVSSERGNQYRAFMEIAYSNKPELAPLKNGRYYIENVAYETFTQYNGNQKLELYDFQSTGIQSWEVTYLKNGYYKITTLSSNPKALSVSSTGQNSSSTLQVEPYLNLETTITSNSNLSFASDDDMARQQWSITQTDSGGFVLRPKCDNYATDWCMTASGKRAEIKQAAYTNDALFSDEWLFHLSSTYIYKEFKARLLYSDECKYTKDELKEFYNEATEYIYETFSIKFELEYALNEDLLNLDASCSTQNLYGYCTEACGVTNQCNILHHRGAARLLDIKSSDDYYTCRIVNYGLCAYKNGHIEVYGLSKIDGQDIVVSEEADIFDNNNNKGIICAIQHELLHNMGYPDEENLCSDSYCIMSETMSSLCGNCEELMRQALKNFD